MHISVIGNDFKDLNTHCLHETDLNNTDDGFGEATTTKEQKLIGKESTENEKATSKEVVAVSISSYVIDDRTTAEENDNFGDFHETNLINTDGFGDADTTKEELPQGKESPEIGETTSEAAVAISISPCIVGDGAAVEEDNDFGDFLETDFNKSDDEFGETLARKEEEPQGKESPAMEN